MKLYTFPPAPNPKRLDIFIREKGIEIDTTSIDLMAGEHRKEPYLSINPWGTVPALVLNDGTLMTEVIGILSYLEELYPQVSLMGNDPISRAQILSWDHRCFSEGITAVGEVFRNSSEVFVDRSLPGPIAYAQIPDLIERGRKRIHGFYQVLDQHLLDQHTKDKKFMVGDAFSVADISAYVFINFSGWVKETIPGECEHLSAWHQKISERSSTQS